MTRLSVNINKFATLRNSRGGNNPNLLQITLDCERFGAQGITVHPRPDERHIRYNDVVTVKDHIKTEFNIEGFPDKRFLELIELAKPAQATLVPDPPEALTSNAGWDTVKHRLFLSDIVSQLHALGVRTSIFVDPEEKMIEGAKAAGTGSIELYTESYAKNFHIDKALAIKPYVQSAALAQALGLKINAGHDLDLDNLAFLKESIPYLDEVSIGHALVCDALYLGLENTIQLYLRKLEVLK
jgi:pyridoxine 5-phosphate synthase